jgi:signal transduction histidine kinase
MQQADQAFIQVLKWRAEDLGVRLGQALLVAILASASVGVVGAGVWIAAAAATALVDQHLSRRALSRPADQPAHTAACASLAVSAATFSSIAVLLLAQRTHGSVAEAVLLLCAINLNNAVMTRSSRLATALMLWPSSLALAAAPFVAEAFGYHLRLRDTVLLELGAIAYLVFIAHLAATLQAENRTILRALEDQGRQRRRAEFAMEEAVRSRARWRMLFDQSPLPQACFSATRLHALLKPHIDAGETRLGDITAVLFSSPTESMALIDGIDGNEALEVLFGAPRQDRRVDPAQLHESFLSAFCEGLNAIDEDGVLAPFETKIVRPNGALIDVRVHVRMPPGQTPAWSLCMISYVDVTEQQRAARAQRAAVAAAEAASRAKSEFLAVMSHEIRTPLNGVLGMAQAMELDPLSPAQKDRLGVIRQSGAALLDILNDVLDLSKIEAGKLVLESADFDLGAIARSVEASFGALAARKGLGLDVVIGPEAAGRWRGDALRVRQVIYNLVGNAVKFTEVGAVTLEVGRCPLGVRIVVRDTGIGIASDRIPRLFEKFVQADSSTTRRFGGSGLGLAICRDLCNAMGGTITVKSTLGKGSAFIVELPLPPAVGDGFAGEALQPAAPAQASSIGSLRVLAAEDNSVNQLVLKTLLAHVGIEPVMVSNGAEALAEFDRGSWDLILMDIQMPMMDGPTATRAIRAREAERGLAPTPIIALTANAMSHQIESYRAAGMNGILAKPIEIAALYEALAAAAEGEGAHPALGAA